jgi:flagellin
MSVINTNVKALVAQNSLTVNNRAMSKTMEQLSTGKRINSAADDAAGLAISTKMTSQIRGLNQAVRNANDGISLIQTAEGATQEITNMLQRMRELAVQSASDTNTPADRAYLNDEFQQLKSEIDRIADKTQWNGVGILNANSDFGTANGNNRDVAFHVGANSNDAITMTFKSMRTSATAGATEKWSFNFASSTNLADGAAFNLTLGNVTYSLAAGSAANVTAGTKDFDFAVSNSAKTTASAATTLASQIQAGLRKNTALQDIVVTANGAGFLTIEDPQGREITAINYQNLDSSNPPVLTALAAPAVATEIQDGVAFAGVFSGNAAIESLNVSEKSTSNTAISTLDHAIKAVNDERSKMGAVVNRLNSAADNLSNVAQNASASRSRILDTDYAQATTELARTQIIQQAATAMLAQANQQPAAVLSLLQ